MRVRLRLSGGRPDVVVQTRLEVSTGAVVAVAPGRRVQAWRAAAERAVVADVGSRVLGGIAHIHCAASIGSAVLSVRGVRSHTRSDRPQNVRELTLGTCGAGSAGVRLA